MKNLKKLSRNQLIQVSGRGGQPTDPITLAKWCCCGANGCSAGVYGERELFTCVDVGTFLLKC